MSENIVVEYEWSRSLYDFLMENYSKELSEDVSGEVTFENGGLYLEDLKLDISKFRYVDKVYESRLDDDVFATRWVDEDLIKCVDECAKHLTAIQGWSLMPLVELEAGGVEYKDFLPYIKESGSWRKGKVPSKVTNKIFLMVNNVLSDSELRATSKVEYFEQVPLMRIFMSGDDLTLGVWDCMYGSYDYYGEITFGKCGNRTVDACLHTIVSEVLKLGKSIKDIYILSRGTCNKMYYRKNSDGEYTITIY